MALRNRKLNASLAALALAGVAASAIHASDASFTAASANPRNAFNSAADWVRPVVTTNDPGSPLKAETTLSATAADAGSGVARVTIQRSPSGAASWIDVCTDTTAPYSCATTLPEGSWDFRSIAVDNAGNSATSAVVERRVVDATAPTVAMTSPGAAIRGTVTLAATASDAVAGVATVAIQRSPAGAGSWTTICTDASSPYSCSLDTRTSATPDGEYDLRAVATDAAGNQATDTLQDVLVDNTVPTATVTVPGSPVRGVVTLAATPSDPGADPSGIASVRVQVSPAGRGTWTDACTATASPWSCRWDSSRVADGSYDFRAIPVDHAGNSGASATLTRTVDNTVATVSMEDPGAFLRGSVTLQASVTSPGASPSVAIQIAPAGTTTWTTLCTVTASPWSCAFDTRTRADGSYDFRAVLTDAGGTKTSNVVSARQIDNTAVRGVDVQSQNKAGGVAGKVEAGDTLVLTYSELMAPGSLIAGWSGSQPSAAYLRVRDGALVGGSSTTDDTIDLFADSTLRTPLRLGTVNLRGNFARSSKAPVLNATVTRQSVGTQTVVTITVGAPLAGAGHLRTASADAAMVWTPSAQATDMAGNPASTAPVTETGALDRDL